MKPAKYTPFPDLCSSSICAEHDRAQSSTSLVVEAPDDVFVIAWAMLLRSYTEDVTPTFKVRARSVTVDTSNWASPVVNYLTAVEGERLTAILTHEVGFAANGSHGPKAHGFRNQPSMDSTSFFVMKKAAQKPPLSAPDVSLPTTWFPLRSNSST